MGSGLQGSSHLGLKWPLPPPVSSLKELKAQGTGGAPVSTQAPTITDPLLSCEAEPSIKWKMPLKRCSFGTYFRVNQCVTFFQG